MEGHEKVNCMGGELEGHEEVNCMGWGIGRILEGALHGAEQDKIRYMKLFWNHAHFQPENGHLSPQKSIYEIF